MKWMIRAYSLGLLAYTGWRTYDFMATQLPTGATGGFIALLFLLATEIGLLLWHEVSMNHTTTEVQSYIAVTLTWLDFAAATGAGIADMIIRSTFAEGYTVPPLLATVLIYGLPLTVALNVAGVLLYLSNDSETVIEREKAKLRHEIHKQVLKDLSDSRGTVANSLKKQIAAQLRDDVTQRTLTQYVRKLEREEQNKPRPRSIAEYAATSNGNGKAKAPKVRG
jgi:hypothetical protein